MLTARIAYTDEKIRGFEMTNFGASQPSLNRAEAAAPLSCL
jgi:hypothetical protein